jgi:hypothetical protein
MSLLIQLKNIFFIMCLEALDILSRHYNLTGIWERKKKSILRVSVTSNDANSQLIISSMIIHMHALLNVSNRSTNYSLEGKNTFQSCMFLDRDMKNINYISCYIPSFCEVFLYWKRNAFVFIIKFHYSLFYLLLQVTSVWQDTREKAKEQQK